MTNADDAFVVDQSTASRRSLEAEATKRILVGDGIRDYSIKSPHFCWFPYSKQFTLHPVGLFPNWNNYLWRSRTVVANRATSKKLPYYKDRRDWYEWHQLPREWKWRDPVICSPFVSSGTHFVLDRENDVLDRSAPVIKMKAELPEELSLQFVGVLNSSVASFWIKDQSNDNGGGGEAWERRYQVNSATLERYPLPLELTGLLARVHRIEHLAHELESMEPCSLLDKEESPDSLLYDGEKEWSRVRALIIAEQEELDWQVYHLYGFTDSDLSLPVGEVPGLALGERAFEIALARRMKAGEAETAWFDRHRSTPVAEVPNHLPSGYRDAVQQRLNLIAEDRSLGLLERPEYKRRWSSVPWVDRVRSALAAWILDRLENPEEPRT